MVAESGDKKEKGRSGGSLFKRILASVIFLPCLFIITRRGGFYYVMLIDIMILVGLWEFYRMMEAKGLRPYKVIGILSGIALSWYIYFHQGIYANFFLSIVFIGIMSLELVRRERRFATYHISVTIFGVFYVAWLGGHLILLRELPHLKGLDYQLGFSYVMIVFIMTWSYDTGAYTVGKLIGRRKIFPSISPGKTLEGLLGGLVFSVAGILVARFLIAGYLSIFQAVVLAVISSLVGQVGDLVESMIKRDARIKDSSATIPGHGGVLDRFDSMLFTSPLIYYILRYFIVK